MITQTTAKTTTCPFCGKTLQYLSVMIGDRSVTLPQPEPCDCPGAISERNKQRAIKAAKELAEIEKAKIPMLHRIMDNCRELSDLSLRFKNAGFSNYETKTASQKQCATICKKYADNISKMQSLTKDNSLFLYGACGTGKSHLAAAIYKSCVNRKACIYSTMQQLLEKLRSTFSESYESALSTIINSDLLIIDDLGKEIDSDWAVSTIYRIFNARYEKCLPVVITANNSLAELAKKFAEKSFSDKGEAIIDRLFEMCVQVRFAGTSYRRTRQ